MTASSEGNAHGGAVLCQSCTYESMPACRRDDAATDEGHATNGAVACSVSCHPAAISKRQDEASWHSRSRGRLTWPGCSRQQQRAWRRWRAASCRGRRGCARGPPPGVVCLETGGPHPGAAATPAAGRAPAICLQRPPHNTVSPVNVRPAQAQSLSAQLKQSIYP